MTSVADRQVAEEIIARLSELKPLTGRPVTYTAEIEEEDEDVAEGNGEVGE